jgi:four helix bundle protein
MDRAELEARAAAFAVAAFHLCNSIRTLPGGRNPADQLADASSSASSNYRATSRARSRREFASKMAVVAEESDEAVGWLEHIFATKLGNAQQVSTLLAEARELRNIFAAAYKTSRQRRGRDDRPPDR